MIPLNLKANKGRCAPLAFQQSTNLSEIVIPDAASAALSYTRPPLAERACCSGDDGAVEAAPQFTVDDVAPVPPTTPEYDWRVADLNLRTSSGRCAPLAFQQPSIESIEIPTDIHAASSYSRPPLRDRACCAGDGEEAEASIQFETAEGPGEQPVIPQVDYAPGTLNLRTSFGRCSPLAIVQPTPDIETIDGASVEIGYTRPPLRERACCSGEDEDDTIRVTFTVVPECMYIALEDALGLLALEDEAGYFALECAN